MHRRLIGVLVPGLALAGGLLLPFAFPSQAGAEIRDVPHVTGTVDGAPVNVQEAELEYPDNIIIDLPGYKPTKKGHPLQVKRAADVILKAKKPVILAGGGVILSASSEELFKLSELLGAPVTTTLMGKGCFPEDNYLSLGMLGMHGRKVSNFLVDDCDCLIAVGCRFSDRTTGDVSKFASKAKIIHIDVDPAEIGKNVPVDVPIVGDAKIILAHLIRVISQAEHTQKKEWTKPLRFDSPD